MSKDPHLAELVVRVHEDIQPHLGQGRVADYIPALVRVDPRQFGLAIVTCKGATASVGDGSVPFSIRSVSKVFTFSGAGAPGRHAVAARRAAVAVWSPGLNTAGNSLVGALALGSLARRTGGSIF